MFKRYCLLTICILFFLYSKKFEKEYDSLHRYQREYNGIRFSIFLNKDTIIIGEPFLLTTKLVNQTNQYKIIPTPPSFQNLNLGTMEMELNLYNTKTVRAKGGMHVSLTSWPYAMLAPAESVMTVCLIDFHSFFGISGYLEQNNMKEITALVDGLCTLTIWLPYPEPPNESNHLSHVSDIALYEKVPFYLIQSKEDDLGALTKLCNAHITWFIFRLYDVQFPILKEVMSSKSIFAPYSYYLYIWYLTLNNEKILECKKFLHKYHDHALEPLIWEQLIHSLKEIGNEDEANLEVKKLQKKYPGYIEGNSSIEKY